MSESTLSFQSSKQFRDKLLARNLPAYQVPGVYSPQITNNTDAVIQSDYNVIDSPGTLITQNPIVDTFIPLNAFGPDGGFSKDISFNNLIQNPKSNLGPYDPADTDLDVVNEFFIDAAYIQNIYGPEGGYDLMYAVTDIQNNNKVYLPYWDPPIFRPSSYNAYNILLNSTSAVGSEGTIAQDSYLVKLGAQFLQETLIYRAALSDNALTFDNGDPMAFGRMSAASSRLRSNFIVPANDFRITLPPDTDSFLTRLQGVYIPTSPIPGDYFLDNLDTRNTGTLGQLVNVFAGRSTLLGDILGPAVSRVINPSIVFLEATGSGQKSALFENLSYNRFRPQYGSTTLGGLATNLITTGINAVLNPTGTQLPGDFYVGSIISEPSSVESPVRDVPIDAFGKETGAIVYGGSELAILYEGNEEQINFGLKAVSYTDGGGIGGNLVWVSPKYKPDAGKEVGVGGQQYGQSPNFIEVRTDYEKSESTNIQFKVGSILDETQRLVDAADRLQGNRRLRHVGNAISQVSKVFNDGYKELTKGSKVQSYINQNGVEVGQEYCRIFAKDIPYYTFSDLQKTDGNIRKFTYSVLDNTYNLNIAPMKGLDSSNIVGADSQTSRVKKYMFSIENLAWKSSTRTGLLVSDLPACERGQNGGRIMWFPPYNLKVSENVRANWNPTTFLGRPEPVYTYKDTTRSGTLSWSIIVDHPSILNVIVNKVLATEQNRQKIQAVIDSFFSGCKKYDIYELAKIYNKIPVSQLVQYQEILSNPRLTEEQAQGTIQSIPVENTSPQTVETTTTNTPKIADFNQYVNLGFYFDNDEPTSGSELYQDLLNDYLDPNNKQLYTNSNPSGATQISEFFNEIEIERTILQDDFWTNILNAFTEKSVKNVTIELEGYASSVASTSYNQSLTERRCDSIKNFFSSFDKVYSYSGATLKEYIDNGSLVIKCLGLGETGVVQLQNGGSIDCSTIPTSLPDSVYSYQAMACRSVRIKTITPTPADVAPQEEPLVTPEQNQTTAQNPFPQQPLKPPAVTTQENILPGLSKKVLRDLLSECDYFEMIREEEPMIYETIKDKIKHFNPAFHSMTPEGLNSRLTFLQQCLRPGDTMPVVNSDGVRVTNDAFNTNFAAPPVLVLRIGDFYNTKIIPNSIDITYEPLLLDTNPEGIGVQPMLANITMSFNFIGGSGLAKPIEQLQNSLSFNYYANTEMYDERAEATEDTTKIDREVLEEIKRRQEVVTTKDVTNPIQNGGGNTIGTIITSDPTPTGETGTISYQLIMDDLIFYTQSYFDTITNQLKTTIETYNKGVLDLYVKDRNYTEGEFLLTYAPIFGKPENLDEKINELFDSVISDIDTQVNPIIQELSIFGATKIRIVSDNMKSYVNNLKTNWSDELYNITQKITEEEQTYVQIPRKLNFIDLQLDGKILSDGIATLFNTSGTTDVNPSSSAPNTYVEFENDFQKVGTDLGTFLVELTNDSILSTTYTSPGAFTSIETMTQQQKVFYMVMSRVFNDTNLLTQFTTELTLGLAENEPTTKEVRKQIDKLEKLYTKEYDKEIKNFNKIFKKESYQEYIRYSPYTQGKTRIFTYNSNPAPIDLYKEELQNIYKTININTDPETWTGKVTFD